MARASKVCIEQGCPEFAVASGRCETHKPDHDWASSTRRKPAGWARTRQRILRRDRRTCVVCGNHATEVDHILAQAFGGGEQHANLRSICYICHRDKSADEATTGKRIAGWVKADRQVEIEALVSRWT